MTRPSSDERYDHIVDPPTHHEIAELAFARFSERGGIDGHDLDDWLEAERELLRARADAHGANHHPMSSGGRTHADDLDAVSMS
jgi:hypothetical protein